MTKEEKTILLTELKKIDNRLDSVDTKLAVYNEQLKIHIKRTELLEQDLHPIKEHVQQVKGAGKLVGLLALLSTILATILVLKR